MLTAASHMGSHATDSAKELLAAMAEWNNRDELGRVRVVNEYFNRKIMYRSDLDLWGQNDYWASPLETLTRDAGDCEDFAIAKYFALINLGVADKKLRLVYVRAKFDGVLQPHMILAYYPGNNSDPWVLDSLVTEFKKAPDRPDLFPVFSFNSEGIWEGVGQASVTGSPTDRLSRWAEVLRKARAEGF